MRCTLMESIVKGKQEEIQLPEELLTSFARFLVPEICKFYKARKAERITRHG